MKILDRYVAKNFLIGYAIAFCVLIGLRVIIDLFVGLDEFVENADQGILKVLTFIGEYYGLHLAVYFRDFSGMITVVAAAFSLGRMIRSNELIAIMASGVSLKRVVGPILCLSLIFIGIFILDQEVIIPSISHKLVRGQDVIPGQESYDVWFIPDGNGSLICAPQYDVNSSTFHNPTIIKREEIKAGLWRVTGKISANQAVYDHQSRQWALDNGRLIQQDLEEGLSVPFYTSDQLKPRDVPVMAKADHIALLSLWQLNELAAQNPRDVAQLYSQKHFRVTDPIISFVTLMISLPVLICRDPRTIKTAVLTSFTITSLCILTSFACKMLATEELFFHRLMPEFWAWLPVIIFLPIAFIELDSMKT